MSACDGGPDKEMFVLSAGGPEMELFWPAAGSMEEMFWPAAGPMEELFWPAAGSMEEMFWPAAGPMEEMFSNVKTCGPGGWPVNRGAGANSWPAEYCSVNTGAEDWPMRPPVIGSAVTGNCGAEDGPITSVPGCGWGAGAGARGIPVTPPVTGSCGVDDGAVTRVAAECPVTRAADVPGPRSPGTELARTGRADCPSKVTICRGGAGFCTGIDEVSEMPPSPVVCWRPGTELVKL